MCKCNLCDTVQSSNQYFLINQVFDILCAPDIYIPTIINCILKKKSISPHTFDNTIIHSHLPFFIWPSLLNGATADFVQISAHLSHRIKLPKLNREYWMDFLCTLFEMLLYKGFRVLFCANVARTFYIFKWIEIVLSWFE